MQPLDRDVLAECSARSLIHDVLLPRPYGRHTAPAVTDPERASEQVVDLFVVQWERAGGLRRLVMRGPVEVDPSTL